MTSLVINIHSPPYTGIHTTNRISPHPRPSQYSSGQHLLLGRLLEGRVEGHGHTDRPFNGGGWRVLSAPLSCPEAGSRNALEPQRGISTATTAEETFLLLSNFGHSTGGAWKTGCSLGFLCPRVPFQHRR